MNTLSPTPSPASGRGELSRWLGLSALVIILDQISKIWITSSFAYGESVAVLGVFDLVLAHNTGAAFSFLSDAGGMERWLFSGIAVAASVWIVALLRKHAAQPLFALALSLILGGALGNLIDRIAYGYVVDFLHFHWDEHYFPAFNLADSAITCGAFLLLWDGFTEKRHGSAAG
ncbi:MAG: lipoprotein signal peptidase [Nitrosomonadales bacterium]|nr:lipoprotein signal peptidase [Nitrosomonadales bacterium]